MTDELKSKESYLHDAYVASITLTISSEGFRVLAIQIHCHPECGYEEWNNKKLLIEFIEPLVIDGALLGHMANAEEINAIDYLVTDKMVGSIKHLMDAGINRPDIVLSVIFQSGSQLDIACQEVLVSDYKG